MLCVRVRLIDVMAMLPALPHEVILGMNFWMKMAIVSDLYSDVWTFKRKTDMRQPEVMTIHSRYILSKKQQDNLQTKLHLEGRTCCTYRCWTNYSISPALQKQRNKELN